MTTKRELPDGTTTITYTSAGRLWDRPDGDLLSVNYGPWEPRRNADRLRRQQRRGPPSAARPVRG